MINKILILGAGKMGSFFCDLLSFKYDVAIFDRDPKRLLYTYNCRRFEDIAQTQDFDPDLVINASTVKYTIDAFRQVLPYLRPDCILSDIASVKNGLPEFYSTCGHPYVSTHPMFGPTFASLANLANENAIIISEGCPQGIQFFNELYAQLGLHIETYTFRQHDRTIAYSLSIPFASTLVFGAAMVHQSAPGTTFKRHMAIARGLMSEDDYLLTEILFNPDTPEQLERIIAQLQKLQEIIKEKDSGKMAQFLTQVRQNIQSPQ